MISIVATSWNRPHLLRNTLESIRKQVYGELYPVSRMDVETIVVDTGTDTETKAICEQYGAKRIDKQSAKYANPARAINAGLRQASGETIILQNAECAHVDPNTIEKLTALTTDNNAVFAHVWGLNPDGSKQVEYCGSHRNFPAFFCGAMKRSLWERFPMDEDFTEPAYDDNEWEYRARTAGIEFVFSNIEVHHQWHARPTYSEEPSRQLYLSKRKAWGVNAKQSS